MYRAASCTASLGGRQEGFLGGHPVALGQCVDDAIALALAWASILTAAALAAAFSGCMLQVMDGFFVVVFLTLGCFLVVEAGLSLALGRAVVRRPWEKRPRSTWESWSQLLLGMVGILAALFILEPAARGPAGIGAFLLSLGSLVGLLLGMRTFQTTDSK